MGLLLLVLVLFIIVLILLGVTIESKQYGLEITGWSFKMRQLLALLVLPILLFGIIVKVDAVEEGILYDPFNGGVQELTLDEGYHIKSIFSKVYSITKKQQSLIYDYDGDEQGETFSVQTKNGEFAWYAVELKYKVENASIVFDTWKGLPSSSNLSQYVQTAIKSTAVDYTIYEILGNKFEESRYDAEQVLVDSLAEFGITLISLNFIDIDAGTDIENAIIRQGTSAKEEEININLQLAAVVAAETARITAEGIANAAIEAATGRAEAVQLEADAEAYALETVATAQQELLNLLGLTPEQYIEYIKWTTWDGELPTTMLGDADVIIPID